MRKFHQEVDELRKSGAYKEALDLARYAYSKLPEHNLLKRSYSWAVYTYLKHKCSLLKEVIIQGDLSREQVVIATDRRVLELNQLCREYRIHKLLVKDLCFSLILRQLCKFDPPPLGLYGLVKWSRSKGLRDEDYKEEVFSHKETSKSYPPLVHTLAIRLESLTSVIDRESTQSRTLELVNIEELAAFAAKVCMHAHDRCEPKNNDMLWRGCWLSRRGAQYENGIQWGIRILKLKNYSPSVWWEIAQCLAEESAWHSLTQSMAIKKSNPQVNHAISCALVGAHEARNLGINELDLVHLYARTALWFYRIGELISARALLTWAIQILKDHMQKIPYDWVTTLDQLGGSLNDYWPHLSAIDQQKHRQAYDWLNAQNKNVDHGL